MTMDWIKKNPAQLTLALVAILAIAATAVLYMKVSGFDANFEGVRGTSVSNAPVEKLDTRTLDDASKALQTPVAWEPPKGSGKLFVSKLYALKDGRLIRPDVEGTMFHPPIPNEWLLKHKLDPLSGTVLSEDPDQDGFTNLEEWNGLDARSHLDNNGQPVIGADGQPLPDDSTNPQLPNQHPPYHTKLELAKIVNIPFRLRVMSIDVPAKVTKPSDVTVQINTIDRGNKTQFIAVGDDIPGTKFKIDSYQQKEIDAGDGTKKDVSEVTIINKETGEKIVLPLKQVVDSPDSYGIFRYKWKKPGVPETKDFPKRRGETFTLPPEPDKTYKLIEIKGTDAIIELPDGKKKTLTGSR
jgi:hypothetical protein